MKLIAISDAGFVHNEALLVNRLFEAGLPVLHLRKKQIDRKSCASLITEISPDFHDRIALHQHHELTKDFNICRLHYREINRSQGQESREATIKSTSVHEAAELKTLSGFDYAFISPVFDSISKPGYKGLIKDDYDPAAWSTVISCAEVKAVALGGIDLQHIALLRTLGFQAIAVLGALWKEPSNAVKKYKELRFHAD